ncbi:MAG: 23S rRNA (guanosine(2251)-2'-O)-methyltransferase RlmB [Chromatiales bacterium]|nr:MAG: 23S rRNA (guanosine(2251)-2'-O)-methyltransferase RlmB [Chromatiales bacterium]
MADRLIYGVQAVRGMLRRCPERVLQVYADEDLGAKRRARIPELDALADRLETVDRAALDRLCKGGLHQGLAARVEAQEPLSEAAAKDRVRELSNPLLLLLDGVQDPRNFGACLRTANAAGVDLVVVGRSRNVGLTPVVSKVAAGAAELQPVAAVANLARFMAFLRDSGVFVIGADDGAPAELHMADLRGPLALVMGAEGEGLRRLTRERCDLLVRIPMRGSVESLNVAVATGVCLYEALRQRT